MYHPSITQNNYYCEKCLEMTELDANTLETLRKYFLENAVSDEKNKYEGVQVGKRGRNVRARGSSTRERGRKG